MSSQDDKAYFKVVLLSESPIKCEYENDNLDIFIGEFQHISFPKDYILKHREQFDRVAHTIYSIFQDDDIAKGQRPCDEKGGGK